MTLLLEDAEHELRMALAGLEDDVFYDVVAISDRLLRGDHAPEALARWAEDAARDWTR